MTTPPKSPLDARRDELANAHYFKERDADELAELSGCMGRIAPRFSGFCYGWDACRVEMQAEIGKLKELTSGHKSEEMFWFKRAKEYEAEIDYLNRMLADERSGDCDKDKTIRRLESNLLNAQDEIKQLQQKISDYEEAMSKYPPNSHAYNVLKKWRTK